MRSYFVDTWFFIALLHERDAGHRFALHVSRTARDVSFVTHDGVLTELLTFFSSHGDFWRNEVAALARRVIANRHYKAVPLDRALFLRGLTLYETRLDKHYSLVDCMSMVVMSDRNLTHVLTNDHHFRQEGFTVVNE
jgi:predicted nucleic acid-binding protein